MFVWAQILELEDIEIHLQQFYALTPEYWNPERDPGEESEEEEELSRTPSPELHEVSIHTAIQDQENRNPNDRTI